MSRAIEDEDENVSWSRSALVILIVSTFGVSQAESQPYAYVANHASGTVSMIDTRTDKVTSTFEVGSGPWGISASVDGARLYIGAANGSLIERDLYENKESARTMIGGSAKAVHLGPKGKLLSVVLEDRDSVALIDPPTLRVTKTVRIGGKRAKHAVFSPDGRWIYADAKGGDSVIVIDVAKGAVIRSITVGGEPGGIGFLPDGSRAYVATGGDEIVVIDPSRHAVVARLKSAAGLDEIAAHPDGKRVFVGAVNAGSVQVLDASANRFIANIEVGAGVSDMAFTADGKKLYVACSLSDAVAVIDTSTYKRIEMIRVGGRPASLVVRDRPNLPRDGG